MNIYFVRHIKGTLYARKRCNQLPETTDIMKTAFHTLSKGEAQRMADLMNRIHAFKNAGVWQVESWAATRDEGKTS